jgi:hypothetical protein
MNIDSGAILMFTRPGFSLISISGDAFDGK